MQTAPVRKKSRKGLKARFNKSPIIGMEFNLENISIFLDLLSGITILKIMLQESWQNVQFSKIRQKPLIDPRDQIWFLGRIFDLFIMFCILCETGVIQLKW
jgi:hypothetical protein